MEEARKPENLPKNRYRDILPCKWHAYFKVYESLSNLVILIVFYWVISVECEQLLPRRIFYPR